MSNKGKEHDFRCVVRSGNELDRFAQPVAGWKRRECYKQLQDYIYGDIYDRVYILYGLRRTGKTTLIRQTILDMGAEMREEKRLLEANGYRYVFIDEVTLLDDFIEGAALLSDVDVTHHLHSIPEV